MTKYRLLVLFKSGLNKEAKDKLFKSFSALIGGTSNEKREELGERKLAYPIKRHPKGEYTVFNFEAKSMPIDFSKRVMMNEDVLRHLLIKN